MQKQNAAHIHEWCMGLTSDYTAQFAQALEDFFADTPKRRRFIMQKANNVQQGLMRVCIQADVSKSDILDGYKDIRDNIAIRAWQVIEELGAGASVRNYTTIFVKKWAHIVTLAMAYTGKNDSDVESDPEIVEIDEDSDPEIEIDTIRFPV